MKPIFKEFDDSTREYMINELEKEISEGNPYISSYLTQKGIEEFFIIEKKIFKDGDVEKFIQLLTNQEYFVTRYKNKPVNLKHVAKQLGFSEFNTWYVRGLSKKLIDLDNKYCEVYRTMMGKSRGPCSKFEGKKIDLIDVYNGHRAKYWPYDNSLAFSIPFHPGCHHSIKRIEGD